jgi:hypothetical protein
VRSFEQPHSTHKAATNSWYRQTLMYMRHSITQLSHPPELARPSLETRLACSPPESFEVASTRHASLLLELPSRILVNFPSQRTSGLSSSCLVCVAYEWSYACYLSCQTVFDPKGHSLPRDAAKPRSIQHLQERCRPNDSPAARTLLTKIREFPHTLKADSASNL